MRRQKKKCPCPGSAGLTEERGMRRTSASARASAGNSDLGELPEKKFAALDFGLAVEFEERDVRDSPTKAAQEPRLELRCAV
eukprot:CAMPEP_0198664076 /NCGR_PEP_ID=MMETSP1467-20131203/54761_1 /TAXON_ID=1462469 /ORGANISM="unid. sp., Strain CCMP2135" /LENGTH=81 /DNA_ID=CAMNT_0044400629 /DNA_START=236 /DNA_END=478 /DNA_ORIENTATION=-